MILLLLWYHTYMLWYVPLFRKISLYIGKRRPQSRFGWVVSDLSVALVEHHRDTHSRTVLVSGEIIRILTYANRGIL